MPSTWFPNSHTYHVAEEGLSRIQFPGTLVPGTPPVNNPPPPVTTVTPPTMHLASEDSVAPLVDPALEAPVNAFIPLSVEPAPPVAQKRKTLRKHRRQPVPV